jgi:translation elongation factor EF-4
VFPPDASGFEKLDSALSKLTLNDASVSIQRTNSNALGQGFRIGFLGMLHMDVFKSRLEDEHGTDIIVTSPCVPYKGIFRSFTCTLP